MITNTTSHWKERCTSPRECQRPSCGSAGGPGAATSRPLVAADGAWSPVTQRGGITRIAHRGRSSRLVTAGSFAEQGGEFDDAGLLELPWLALRVEDGAPGGCGDAVDGRAFPGG